MKDRIFKPLGKRVLIKPTPPGDRMSGDIYLPDTAKKQNNEGVVFCLGPAVTSLHEQDAVLFGKWIGVEVYLNGETLLLMSEDDILGIFTPVFETVEG